MASHFSSNDSQDSFADLLSTIIVFVRGKLAGGEAYWAYLAMKPSIAKAFHEEQQKGTAFDLEQYGTIIEWGKGDEPPADIADKMKNTYAAGSEYEKNLLERLDKIE